MDEAISDWLTGARPEPVRVALVVVTSFGLFASVAVLAGVVLWRAHARAASIAIVYACLVASHTTVDLLKRLVERPRPPSVLWGQDPSGWSFPSGHSANAAFLAVVIVCWLPSRWRSAAAIALAVPLSRVWLGVHWPSDVVVGAAMGAAWAWAAARASHDRYRPRM